MAAKSVRILRAVLQRVNKPCLPLAAHNANLGSPAASNTFFGWRRCALDCKMSEPYVGNADPGWVWRLEWSEITPRLLVGSCPKAPADLDVIRSQANVSALLSLQHDLCHANHGIDYRAMRDAGERMGLVMVRSPIRDFDAADARRNLARAVRLLDSLVRDHQRVYVHCTAGVGRSALTVLGYLVLVEGAMLEVALALMRARRPVIFPNVEALLGCRADLLAGNAGAIEQRAAELRAQDSRGEAADLRRRAEQEVLRNVLRAA